MSFFFFNDTATTEIYTLSLHDALPISKPSRCRLRRSGRTSAYRTCWPVRPASSDPAAPRSPFPPAWSCVSRGARGWASARRSEEHTSELQSRQYLVCRLLLEKKKRLKY